MLFLKVYAESGDSNGNGNRRGFDRDDGGVGGLQPTTRAGAGAVGNRITRGGGGRTGRTGR